MWEIETNLSLANMDWDDFAGHEDDDGLVGSGPRPSTTRSRRSPMLDESERIFREIRS